MSLCPCGRTAPYNSSQGIYFPLSSQQQGGNSQPQYVQEQSHGVTASSPRLEFIKACLTCQAAALELVKFDDMQHDLNDGRFVNDYRQHLRGAHLDATGHVLTTGYTLSSLLPATSAPTNPFYNCMNDGQETPSQALSRLKALGLTRSWLNAHVNVFNFILQSFDLEIGRLRNIIVDNPTR